MTKRVCIKCQKTRWAKMRVERIGAIVESSVPKQAACLPCRRKS